MHLYFTSEYASLYEKHEEGEFHEFSYRGPEGHVYFPFLKREIPLKIKGETYFDIISPYGFGGPIILDATDEKAAYEKFSEAFSDYCKQEKIVSEFVRFHPFMNDELLKWYKGEVIHAGRQIIRDLHLPDQLELSKSTRRDNRRAIKLGLTAEFDETGERLEEFLSLYYGTMERNEAGEYYYFDREFFEQVHEKLSGRFVYVHVMYEGKSISTGLLLFDDTFSYAFLGGTDSDYFKLHANLFLEVESIRWLKEKGLRYYLLGGGHQGEDGIYNFKKKFAASGIHSFYIGRTIHDADVYQQLVTLRKQDPHFNPDSSFFPAYRATSQLSQTTGG